MKTIKYFLPLALVTLLWSSCNKDLLNEKPPHFTTLDKLYVSAEGFQAGLNGLYATVRNEREGWTNTGGVGWQYQTGLPLIVGLDDVATGGNSSGDPAQLVGKSMDTYNIPSGKYVSKSFEWLYSIVNAANSIVLRGESSRSDSFNWNINGVNQRQRIIGEAFVIRAWAYRILMAFWGDVPLNLQESTGSNYRNDWTRTPQKEMRLKLVEDLEKAAEGIPWAPFAAGSMTKGVALHYLAETYLALCVDDPANAAEYAAQAERFSSIVIGTDVAAEDATRFGATNRSLMPDFAEMFKPANVDITSGNTESLWTWQWKLNATGGGNNMMRHTFNTYYTNSRDGFDDKYYYNNGMFKMKATTDRGSWGWCQAYITPRVMELYYKSTTTTNYADQNWDTFTYEDRGGDDAIVKYFILNASPGEDVIAPEGAGLVNPDTGRPWATGDKVWFASTTKDATRSNAYGVAYQNISDSKFGNRQNYIYTQKFKYSDEGYETATSSHLNQMYLRLAETYLVRAEARVRLGNLGGAATDINALRNRAHALDVSAADFGSTLISQLDFVLDERSRELICEEHRRVTLARMGRKEFLWRRIMQYNAINAGWFRKADVHFAIPEKVISTNRVPFPQNPGLLGGPALDESNWPTYTTWAYEK